MSSADYDVAYCDACERCHLNGICPLTNKAQKVVSMTDAGWALKRAKSLMGVHVEENVRRDAAWLLQLEHARAIRIVKAEIKRVELDQHTYTAGFKMTLLKELQSLLSKLQRGRGGKG